SNQPASISSLGQAPGDLIFQQSCNRIFTNKTRISPIIRGLRSRLPRCSRAFRLFESHRERGSMRPILVNQGGASMRRMSIFANSRRFLLSSIFAAICIWGTPEGAHSQAGQPAGPGRAETQSRKIGEPTTQTPQHVTGGFDLPNGWRITPAGKSVVETEDMVLKMVVAPDGKAVIASHSGYNPHGLVVIDTRSHAAVQR